MLTILIPSYNHEKYVIDCLKKALEVEIREKRIIVIDDGSVDSTVRTIRNYIESFGVCGVEIIEKKNSGLVSSLNLGLMMTKSEFLYLVASDDIPDPRGIAECVELLKETRELQFCVGGGVNFSEGSSNESPIYGARHRDFFCMPVRERMVQVFLNYPSPLLLQSTVFRTAALRSIGGWDPDIVLDDYPTFVKLLARFPCEGRDFIFRPAISTVKYRHHGLNTYRNTEKQFLLVRQAMGKLAPTSLKNRAIGKALAYYILVGLRYADFAAVCRIVKKASWMEIVHALPSMANVLVQKFGKAR